MAQIAQYIFNQYLDASGAVLNAGTITAYAAGTLNPKDIYTTSTGDVTASNPLELGADGTANFYIDGTYDLLLKNSAGTTLRTIDGVSSTGSSSGTGVVNTLALLRGLASGAFTMVNMLGETSTGDGEGGMFWWDSTSSAADDGIYVVQPSSSPATGRWIRLTDDLYVRGATPRLRLADTDGSSTFDIQVVTNRFSIQDSQGGDFLMDADGTTMNVGYSSGATVLKGPNGITIGTTGDSVGFFSITPQAKQAHIIDADGSLADITTKFNTLLADLEGYGLLATS